MLAIQSKIRFGRYLLYSNFMIYNQGSLEVNDTIDAWQKFIDQNDWRELINGVNPKQPDCYELPNYLNRYNEDFAIVDMSKVSFSDPHYHPEKDVEIYFVLQGSALMVVGLEEQCVINGDVIVIPPYYAHYAIPDKNFVIAAVNIPPFNPNNFILITENQPGVKFSKEQFEKLTKK